MTTIGIDASRAEAKIKTGVERYSYELLLAIAKSRPQNVRVVLYSRSPLPPELGPFDDNWKNVVLNWPPKFLWTQIRLGWEMLRRPPDTLFIMSHLLPPILPARTAITVHDAFPMYFPKMFPFVQRTLLRFGFRDACRRADEIFVPSHFVADQIYRWRKSHVTVTPLGVVVPEVTAKAAPKGKYFVFIGRIEKKKNLGVLIDAFKKFSASHPDYKLHFVGRFASGAEDLVKQAQASGVVDKIEFCGALPDPVMFSLLKGAVALLHPCPYEGFGIPAVEAMKLGVPAVVSSAGAIAEVTDEAGIVVDPFNVDKWAEAMNQITFDIFRETLIAKGKARAAEFTWGRCAEATWKILSSGV